MYGGNNGTKVPAEIGEMIDDFFATFRLKPAARPSKIKAQAQRNLRRTDDCPTILLPKKEYGKVMHELNNNLTKEERNRFIITRAIGDYMYTIENYGFNDYRIIGKRPIGKK